MERIRQLRNEKGFSQARLAVMADMDPATLNRLEQGKGNPNLKTIMRVADALGVSVGDLFPKGQNVLPLDYFVAEAPLEEEVLFRQEYASNDFDAVMARAQDVMREALSQYVHGEVSLVLEVDNGSIEVRAEALSRTTTPTTLRVGRRKAKERT